MLKVHNNNPNVDPGANGATAGNTGLFAKIGSGVAALLLVTGCGQDVSATTAPTAPDNSGHREPGVTATANPATEAPTSIGVGQSPPPAENIPTANAVDLGCATPEQVDREMESIAWTISKYRSITPETWAINSVPSGAQWEEIKEKLTAKCGEKNGVSVLEITWEAPKGSLGRVVLPVGNGQ